VTRIDFYLLPVSEPHGKLSFACRLAEKAWQSGHQVYVHGSDATEAEAIDALLWSFRDTSFVPHRLLDAATGEPAPVEVGSGETAADHHDVMINLGAAVPPLFSRFERVAEIVLNDPQALAASRQRWTFYKDRGYQLQHHDMQHLRSAGDRDNA
jgi:DNA polymerase III subunit chi